MIGGGNIYNTQTLFTGLLLAFVNRVIAVKCIADGDEDLYFLGFRILIFRKF